MNSKTILGTVVALVVACVIFFAGMQFGGKGDADNTVKTDTVQVERQLSRRDTTGASTPGEIAYYEPPPQEETHSTELTVPDRFARPDTVVDHDTVYVDTTYDFKGIDRNSVHVGSDEVQVYAWDFESGTNVRMNYPVPEPTWDWGVRAEANALYIPMNPSVSVGDVWLEGSVWASYHNLELNVGPALNGMDMEPGIKFGIAYEFK